jgi:hypothetical protein
MAEILLFIIALLVLGALARGIQALAAIVNFITSLIKPRRKPGNHTPSKNVHETHP